jgi:hypothetical protein
MEATATRAKLGSARHMLCHPRRYRMPSHHCQHRRRNRRPRKPRIFMARLLSRQCSTNFSVSDVARPFSPCDNSKVHPMCVCVLTHPNRVIGSILLVFSGITLILCAVEFVLCRRQKLSPVTLLVSSCIKFVMWMIYFVFVCIAAARGAPSALDLVLGIILVTTSLGQVVLGANYAIKHRKSGVARGHYQDVEGGQTDNMASIPRSKTWRASIPAVTVNSREFNAEDLSYESFRASLMEAEALRESREARGLDQALRRESPQEAETQTLASSIYDESTATWTIATPPRSPSLGTELSHPPVAAYSDLRVYDFEQADLALSGFYGSSTTEGETRRQ